LGDLRIASDRALMGPWTPHFITGNNQIGGALKAGMVPNRHGAVTSAVLVHLRVEPAHFDWRWRERPALALLAWEAMARDPLARLRRIQAESIGTTINFRAGGYHQSRHRSIALADRISRQNKPHRTCSIQSTERADRIIADGLRVDHVRTGDHGPKL
jgi:hypothetical protein